MRKRLLALAFFVVKIRGTIVPRYFWVLEKDI